ncbi:MAG TPA: tRNA 2-thiouridine(34) synthase MnmA [Patescibacteria group bacterium]|nr:tRNA 2-thiouridine(34) synthase MnmA [Patescibacteria group bacterium]
MKRLLVGMSGGVDSSVAAAMLAAAGHDVIGVSLQLYDHSESGRVARCCSPEDFLDARRVASLFGFPYYVINKEELFSRRVLDYFVEEYRVGRTPNPCARCNADVKFEALADLARSLGAEAVATGHYARLLDDPASGHRRLMRAADPAKDQSYFLFDLTQEQLDMALFPLGDMTKRQVREQAIRFGLDSAGKPESQDVCFVEGGDYRDFLRRRTSLSGLAEPEGAMVGIGGETLGRHDGLSGYTVGQRRGLGVAASKRLYVVAVDAPGNRVVLGGEEDLLCDRLSLTGVRCHATGPRGGRFEASVRVRYRHAGAPAKVTLETGERATVTFDEPQRSVSAGQAAVFYQGDLVIGGGWIDAVRRVAAGNQTVASGA